MPQSQIANIASVTAVPITVSGVFPFCEIATCAVPQWQVSHCCFFTQTPIPALYQLGYVVSARVYMTTSMWSCKHGQINYISLMFHWVNLLELEVLSYVVQLGEVSIGHNFGST